MLSDAAMIPFCCCQLWHRHDHDPLSYHLLFTQFSVPASVHTMLPSTSRLGIFQKLAKTLRIGNAKYIVGQDLAGNSYLELPSLSGSTDPRHTRRSIQWAEKRELGDYDQRSIPVQWVMWLRHTRREAPSIEELVRDRERILLTQANAAKLALEDKQRREREQQARLEEHEEAKLRAQQKLVESQSRGGGPAKVPTATVVDQMAESEAEARVRDEGQDQRGRMEQQRMPDQDVWAASRARLAAKGQLDPSQQADFGSTFADKGQDRVSTSLQQAMDRRAARRAGKNEEEAEKERARREMSKSPLDAFVPMPKARR